MNRKTNNQDLLFGSSIHSVCGSKQCLIADKFSNVSNRVPLRSGLTSCSAAAC